jgi:DNA helicase II / ATP-dependent DNA helicase PcrA
MTIRFGLAVTRLQTGACKRVYLTENYRSHPAIVDFYNEWMRLTDWEAPAQDGAPPKSFRFRKTIVSVSEDRGDRPAVFKLVGQDGQDNWADQTAAFLRSRRDDGFIKDWNQVAFLFRSVTNVHRFFEIQMRQLKGVGRDAHSISLPIVCALTL